MNRLALKNIMHERLTSVRSSKMKDVNIQEGKTKTAEDRIIEYVEYAKKIDDLIDKLVKLKMEAVKKIEKIEDGTHRILLTERYINNKEWDEVAKSLGYEQRYTLKIHNDALRAFVKLDTKKHIKTL